MLEELEQLLKRQIKNLQKGEINNERIISFYDFKNPYAILKPRVIVEIELKKGVTAKIDVTDYFKEEIK